MKGATRRAAQSSQGCGCTVAVTSSGVRANHVLRPKGERNVSYFYSLISRDTTEQEFARNRQLFLTEQGYRYLIESRRFDEHHQLSEPIVWKQLLVETGY